GRRWTSQVRLVVEGERLTWTSAKGSAAYVRCGRRAG
ncbi:peptidase inhibitor family I36 protein, partial [Methylobacterium sp. A54F]